jgi:hypothetical protein
MNINLLRQAGRVRSDGGAEVKEFSQGLERFSNYRRPSMQ